MTHEWKIGDWAELRSNRYLVYRVVENGTAWAIPECGGFNEIMFDANDKEVKKLDGCDSWTWQPPKPIEPPEGYRLITEGVVVNGDMCLQKGGWYFSTSCGIDVKELLELGAAQAYARKITPKVRPMTRAEFLAAWKQRNYCPLIDEDNEIDVVLTVMEETEYDLGCVNLNNAGWCFMDELSVYKFASDDSPLTVEE